ncbi:hypothetical protein HDV57DRAFT_495793 [Trichoderma longibrachiatum]
MVRVSSPLKHQVIALSAGCLFFQDVLLTRTIRTHDHNDCRHYAKALTSKVTESSILEPRNAAGGQTTVGESADKWPSRKGTWQIG